MDQIPKFVLNNEGVKVRGAKTDQFPKFVLNNEGVRSAKMDQIPKFVVKNGGSEGSEGPKWIKLPNSC